MLRFWYYKIADRVRRWPAVNSLLWKSAQPSSLDKQEHILVNAEIAPGKVLRSGARCVVFMKMVLVAWLWGATCAIAWLPRNNCHKYRLRAGIQRA